MTVDVVFPSPWEKLQRAKFHVGELTEAVRKRVEQLEGQGERMFTFEQDYRPRLHCIVFTIESGQPADVRWSVMIGDAFHNLRSALDHIAWQLVVAGKRPPHTLTEGQQRRVQYPIYTDREDFNDWLPKRLPGVDKRKIAVIRGLQPYRWGRRHAEQDSLAVLEKFSNLDKHRALQASIEVSDLFALGLALGVAPQLLLYLQVRHLAADPDSEFGQLRLEPLGLVVVRVPLRIRLLQSPGQPSLLPGPNRCVWRNSITRATARFSLT